MKMIKRKSMREKEDPELSCRILKYVTIYNFSYTHKYFVLQFVQSQQRNTCDVIHLLLTFIAVDFAPAILISCFAVK